MGGRDVRGELMILEVIRDGGREEVREGNNSCCVISFEGNGRSTRLKIPGTSTRYQCVIVWVNTHKYQVHG